MLHSCGETKPTLSYSAGEEELDNEANDTAETSSEEKGEEEEDDSDEEAKPTAHTAVNYYSNVCPIVRELSQLLRTHKVYALIRRMVRPKGRLTREQKRIMANELNEITQLYNFVLRTRGAGATKDRICIKQTYLFPCVVEFVLRLCSRVENSNSALVSSLELLQFIMTEIQRSALNFAMLLFVSCPACLPMFYQFRDFRDALFFISELLYKAGLIKKGDITNNGETSPEKVVFLLKVLEIETEYFDPSTGIFSVFCKKNPNNRSSFWRHHSCPCAHTHQTVFQLLQYSEYCSEQNCLISPPHFVPWKFLSAVYDAALSFESEETGEPKKKAAKKQTKGQKAKESAEATNPAPTHEKWATATLQHIHVESEVFDESNHNKRYNNIVLTHQYILSQMDPRKKNDAGFNFYILMRQADRDPFNSSLPGDRRSVESLLPLLDVTNHIALQVKGGNGDKCTCTTLPYTSTYIEHHERHLAELVNSLEEEELMLPFSCVPMKNNHYKSLLKEEQFYSRALNVSYGKQQDLFQEMDVDDIIFNACEAGNRLCDVEKELSTNEESAHLMEQLYKTYIKNCTLKQHQIQNLLAHVQTGRNTFPWVF
ncbi:hypothetical protein, conserved [Angomonas deanei]|uniref:Uncharacterized protein n=1 Tax=Angomonas deanei TaxID=59799 RepID=A0A7G2C5D6_9TRYP|nr:hypothetical protein, conserved [Angomonas deanei]